MKIVLNVEEIEELEELVDNTLTLWICRGYSRDSKEVLKLGRMIEQLEILKLELEKREEK